MKRPAALLLLAASLFVACDSASSGDGEPEVCTVRSESLGVSITLDGGGAAKVCVGYVEEDTEGDGWELIRTIEAAEPEVCRGTADSSEGELTVIVRDATADQTFARGFCATVDTEPAPAASP
jgi:hypothetical protein